MTGQGQAQHGGTHRSIRFVIIEGERAGTWRYSFSIGGRNFAGKMQAVMGLLVARRVKMKIDRLLRQDASAKAQAGVGVEPDVARDPIAPPSAAQSAASSTFGDDPRPVQQKADSHSTIAFACKVCNLAYEAVQISAAAKGIFRCAACGWPVHQWDGAYDYRSWQRLEKSDETRARLAPSAGYED